MGGEKDAAQATELGKVHTSSLAFIPNKSTWGVIQDIRQRHDRQINRWPPHINMLYPFIPADKFGGNVAAVSAVLSEVQIFSVTFDKISYFRHGKSCTAFLSLDNASFAKMRHLQGLLEAAFPHCGDLSRRAAATEKSAFHPHVTVGQFTNERDVLDFINKQIWKPLTVTVDCLSMLSRSSQTPFVSLHVIALAGGQSATVTTASTPPVESVCAGRPTRSAGFYQFSPQDDRLRVCFDLPSSSFNKNVGATDQQILFVVDNSSSMSSGSSYESVKTSVQYMISRCSTSNQEPAFILYNSKAKLCSAKHVLDSYPQGATSFENAFQEIMSYINQQPLGTSVSVVFMTDGDDTVSRNLKQSTLLFRTYLKTCRRNVVVHTLGFGRGHKRAFLEKLATMGNAATDGCYRYAEGTGISGMASAGSAVSDGSEGAGDTLDDDLALGKVMEEMFDFLQSSLKLELIVGGKCIEVDSVRKAKWGHLADRDDNDHDDDDDGCVAVDVVLNASDLDTETRRTVQDAQQPNLGDLHKKNRSNAAATVTTITDAITVTIRRAGQTGTYTTHATHTNGATKFATKSGAAKATANKVGDLELTLHPVPPDAIFRLRCVEEQDIESQEDLHNAQQRLGEINPFLRSVCSRKERQGVMDLRTSVQVRSTLWCTL